MHNPSHDTAIKRGATRAAVLYVMRSGLQSPSNPSLSCSWVKQRKIQQWAAAVFCHRLALCFQNTYFCPLPCQQLSVQYFLVLHLFLGSFLLGTSYWWYHLVVLPFNEAKLKDSGDGWEFCPADLKNSSISLYADDKSVSSGAAGPKWNIILLWSEILALVWHK